jgi:hypothetical protein
MPVIPYYQGRPAHMWIGVTASKRRRNPARPTTQLSDYYQALAQHLSEIQPPEFTSSKERIAA